MKLSKLAPVLAMTLLAVIPCGCKRLKARDQLNKGVASFRNAQFQSAINYFQTAVTLDPTLLNARLYLATSYAQLYIPGGESPENLKIGQQSINAFEEVLKMDPNNTTALASIGLTYYQMRKLDKAKEYQKRRLESEPNNAEPYYWIGVLNWGMCFPRRMQLRKDLNLADPKDPKKPDVLPLLPAKAQAQLAQGNGALVDEAIRALQKALELKPNDSDAMAYLNLMYREKSDLETDPHEREGDLKQAEDWVEKALAIRKQAAGGPRTSAQ